MPPRTPSQPTKPDDSKIYSPPAGSKFDFILKNDQAPKSRLAMPSLPKPVLFLLTGVLILFTLIIIFSLLSSRGNAGTKQLVDLLSRQQEIIRVSSIAKPLLRNSDTLNLEATAEASATSDKAQLLAYLKAIYIKVNQKKLTIYLNKTSDSSLKTAAQNNNADSIYTAYLKTHLADYRAALRAAFADTGQNGRLILSDAFDSTQVILNNL